jgi:hypothetical protein
MLTKDFVLAGRAVFTVSNAVGERYTFKVVHKDGAKGPVWFVSLLTGPDNESDYSYLGILDAWSAEVVLTRASRYKCDSKPVKVLQWACKMIWSERALPAGYKMHHEGCCGRCGRPLTVPESIESGFGPECVKKVFLSSFSAAGMVSGS